jgi:hypothetical protein
MGPFGGRRGAVSHFLRRATKPAPCRAGMLLHIDGSKHRWFQDDRYYETIWTLCFQSTPAFSTALSGVALQRVSTRVVAPTSRSCGEFPGIGRILPSRHFRLLMVTTIPRVWRRTVAPPARPSAPSSNRNSGSTCFSAPADEALSSAMVWQALSWAAARISPHGDTVR